MNIVPSKAIFFFFFKQCEKKQKEKIPEFKAKQSKNILAEIFSNNEENILNNNTQNKIGSKYQHFVYSNINTCQLQAVSHTMDYYR